MSAVSNHPSVQGAKDTVVNGEVSAIAFSLVCWAAANDGLATGFQIQYK